jgi:acyl dehydratase
MAKIATYADVRKGQQIPELEHEITPLTLVKYCGAADDYAQQHWDHVYMTGLGFPSVVGHGWLTFAHMCQAVTDWIPLEIADIKSYAVRYHRPTLPGIVRCGGEVIRTDDDGRTVELALWAKDGDGTVIASSPMVVAFV